MPPVIAVSEDGFATAVRDLLLTRPGTTERAIRLGAVESRQMMRAAARFKAHAPDRGLAAVSGGLYLVRTGEAVQGMLGPDGAEALRGAAREVASRGDEGRAQALYDLLLSVSPDADTRAHIDALSTWVHDAVASGGPVESAGELERVAVHRRLLEPSQAALDDAAKATGDWIARAVMLRDRFRKTRIQPSGEEGAQAWRALETGPMVLSALYLRDADIDGASAAIDGAHARDLLEAERPQLASALQAAAQERTADRCVDLLSELAPLTGRDKGREDDDFAEDRETFAAAAFSVASECYRLDPSVPRVALTLGAMLEGLGMAEAAPAVLTEAVNAHPDGKTVSQALALALGAMASEQDAGDAAAARRAFNAAAPLLAVASRKALANQVYPSAARLRAVMGEIDLREGRLDEAKALFTQSAGEEKSGSVLLSLARIEWRDGQTRPALGHLGDALSAPDTARDPALHGEILLLMSDVARDRGDAAGARAPLTEALKELARPHRGQSAGARAEIERVLSRVLDRFGAAQPAERALERAYAAAPGDRREEAQTIELIVGRAFVRGDLAGAREGLQRAVGADLDKDDLVYFALWVRLLERQGHVPPDAVSDRVFASIPDDSAGTLADRSAGTSASTSAGTSQWVATLARFGEGKLRGDDLVARAATPIQKYEALFYSGVDLLASGDTKGGDDRLRQVIAGTGLELSEVNLARDILDPSRTRVAGPLPAGVPLP